MARLRFEDLLRHFAGDMVQVVGANAKARREERERAQEEKRLSNKEKLEMRLREEDRARDRRQDERNAEADERARRADARAEASARRQEKNDAFEEKNPWVYQGMRFPTKEERDAARREDLSTAASISAANRAPRERDDPETPSRLLASAQGDAERWYSRRAYLNPEYVEGLLRSQYPRLRAGEISRIVEEARAKYNRSGGGSAPARTSRSDR